MRLQVIKNGLVKGILWISLLVIFIFIAATSLLRIPAIQTELIQRITGSLSEKTGFEFEIGYINLNWFDVLKINDLKVTDTHDSTMIFIPEAKIDFSISSILNKNHKHFDKIKVTDIEFNMYKHIANEPLNITRFIDTLKYLLKGDGHMVTTIDKIEIEDSRFFFKNFTTDVSYPGFDLNTFRILEMNCRLSDFSVHHDTIRLVLNDLTGLEEKTNLRIHQFRSNLTVHQREMKFGNLDLKVGDSHIKDSIAFTYNKMSNLRYFMDSVQIYVKLDNSTIISRDLAWFSKEFKSIIDVYKISGVYKGRVKDFTVRNLDLTFGQKGHIHGFLSFSGLPDFDETFIAVRLNRSFVEFTDLEQYFGEKVLNTLTGIEQFSFTGNFTGFPNDFVAYGNFDTNIGNIITDINLKIRDDITAYVGKLITRNFDIGIYSGIKLLQTVDMHGIIRGEGLKVSDADFILNGIISRLGINHYDLKNIETNARFASEFFSGELSINDPNLRITASGSIDMRNNINNINLKARLDTLIMKPLNLSETPASLSSYIDIDIHGLKIDSISGEMILKDFFMSYDTNTLVLKELKLTSVFEENSRSLILNSDNINISLTGNYHYTTAYKDFLTLLHEYELNLANNAEALNKYYAGKETSIPENYDVKLQMDLHDVNPLVQLFYPSVMFSKGIRINADFRHGHTSILNLNTRMDSIRIENNLFTDNLFDINASKISDSTNVLASIYVSSEAQHYSNNAKTQKLSAQAIWNRNEIDFNLTVEQKDLESYADIFGEIIFLPDLTVIKLNPSDLQALNEKWEIVTNNAITISGNEIGFQNVGLQKSFEKILLDGRITEDPLIPLTLNLQNVELSNFNQIITKDLKGSGNGYFQIKNYYNDILFETNLLIKDFQINDFLIGDIYNKSIYNNVENKFDLEFQLSRDAQNIIYVSGDYYPGNKEGLHLNATLDKADLKIIEPFIENYFSQIQGVASGNFTVTGNPNYPILGGTGKITFGGMKINYLNTFYTFDADILLNNNEIGFRNIRFRDRDGSMALLSGGFFHNGFDNIVMDFSGNFTDFMFLNTSFNDNDLFYGTGRGSGEISIKGPPQNLFIDVTATTSANTRVFIPLGGTTEIDQEEFIHFISFTREDIESAENIEPVSQTVKGLDFKLDLTITRDAYIELIFDVTVGDIIRGRGNGDLSFHFDPNGDFTMYGDYTIEEGGYNFTLYNIVNKEFNILPGSKISWLADPYEGILDIEASYEQYASVGPLLDTLYRNAPQIRRRYPSNVILDLKGPLLSPEIKFSIIIEDYPNTFSYNGQIVNLDTELSAVQATWALNKQELQKQVFSLMILRQFSEKYINTGGTVGRSVSEFVSNQLSYWISQMDENLEIDLDFGDITEETYNTFQMRLSYTFLDGRLRVTRDGGFTDKENQPNVASILGDWSIEYMLTESGSVRVKLFQEINYSTLDNSYASDYAAIKGGVSILYTQSYNEIKEIFDAARKKQKIREKDNTESGKDKVTRQDIKPDDFKKP